MLHITRDKGIPFIDRMASSAAWVENIGRAQASAFYVDGDATRANEEGARVLATLVVEGVGRKLRSSPCGSRVGPASMRMGSKEPAAVSSSPGHFG
ncbi:hypothetical protein WME98_12005 [Sorangium sp. So ce296]|uniref:hypothetical protein n=1 Tax=Sorangium sp. So ce296 TaxID=3133296 RepID=UPI003F5E7281